MKGRRKFRDQYQWQPDLDEDNVPSSTVTEDQPVLESLIALLTTLLSGKEPSRELLSEAVVKTLHESQSKGQSQSKESKLGVTTPDSRKTSPSSEILTNKQVLTKQLFQTIREKSVDFIVMSRTSEKVVYGDPYDPENPEKQIEYRWNAQTKAWKIIPGPKANAIIPDERSNQLVTVNAGKAQSYGTGKAFEIGTAVVNESEQVQRKSAFSERTEERGTAKPPKDEHESIDSRLRQGSKQLITQKMGAHRLYAFSVPEGKKGDLQHYAGQFANESCERGRSTLLGDIVRTFQATEHPEVLETLCYTDKAGNWYVWKELGSDGKLGLKYKPDGTIDVLLPEKSTRGEHLVFLGHKDVGESGFAGGQLLYLKKDGSVGFAANSNYETPKFSRNVERISEQEMEQHIINARQSAQAFLEGRHFIAEVVQPGVRITERKEPVISRQRKEVVGSVTARLEEQRTVKPKPGLPENIKVTGLNGAPVFEMHCAFRQEVFKVDKVEEDPETKQKKIVQEEQGPIDTEGSRYAANVYVLKRVGSDISKDRSNALIIEISDTGEIRFRSGWTGDNFVQAKITVNKNGKEYVAKVGTKDGWINHDFDEQSDGTPFRSSNDAGFMCVRGCLGSIYEETNKRIIENPALAKILDI